MIILGVVLLVLGYWLLPDLVPNIPPPLDHLSVVLGWIFLVVGLIMFFYSTFTGRSLGGRRYWY
jgi:hypothetical protein